MNNKLSVIFAGTPEISATVLNGLIESDIVSISQVLTQPDRPSGRGKQITESPVKTLAKSHNIPVYQPTSFKKEPEAIDTIRHLKPDLMIVIAYGLILPKSILTIPKYGCINIHVSLLPRWRGAAPIQRAIEAGDNETGISIMQMDEGLDTGDILNSSRCLITASETAQTLHDKLAKMSIPLLLETIELIQSHQTTPIKQSETLVTYAEKITKAEGNINWQLHAKEIERKIRAFTPWPGSFTQINGEAVKLFDASVIDKVHHKQPGTVLNVSKNGMDIAAKNGILSVKKLQFPGKKAMSISELINGRNLNLLVGNILGE